MRGHVLAITNLKTSPIVNDALDDLIKREWVRFANITQNAHIFGRREAICCTGIIRVIR